MDKLALVIGPAPSELTKKECLILIQKERDRVRQAFLRFNEKSKAGLKSKPKTKVRIKLADKASKFDEQAEKLAELGINVEEMLK